MQLKPVKGRYTFEKPKETNLRNVHDVLNLWDKYDVYELQMNHRQGEDKEYENCLNRIRIKEKN